MTESASAASPLRPAAAGFGSASGSAPGSTSDSTLRPATLQLVDHRGNVVLVVDAARFTGTVARLPRVLAAHDEVEVTLIVGFEAVQLRAVVVSGCDVRAGAVALVSLSEWIAGGRRFCPADDAPRSPAGSPTDRPAAEALGSAGLTGRLEQLSLVDVVQLLCAGQRSATIEVHPESDVGRPLPSAALGLVRGAVTHAQIGAPGKSGAVRVGEDALFAVLAAGRGSFAVRFDAPTPTQNIHRETTFLLLEHLRRLDEAARTPSSTTAPTSAPAANLRLSSVPDGDVVVRPAMAPTVAIPAAVIAEPKTKKKRPSLPPQPERSAEKRTARPDRPDRAERAETQTQTTQTRAGRFSRFFDEVSQSASAAEHPRLDEAAPPFAVDDADFAVTDARFTSLAVAVTATELVGGPFERDTDIVDRALISA